MFGSSTTINPPAAAAEYELIDATDQWIKMRKSLGSKRREISRNQIDHIVRLYGDHEPSEASKIFRNEDFGYTTITVERALQLNWTLSSDRIELALATKALSKLPSAELENLATVLRAAADDEVSTELPAFTKRMKKITADAGVTLAAPQLKALIDGL
jgi:type I restriction enzyme M protein